jgi:hypothetical protein
MNIEYYKKSNYGIESMYIKDIKIAEAVRGLTDKKTISNSNIKCLELLGFTFTEVLE